MENPVFAFLST